MNTLMCLVCILCMHPVVTFSWLQSIVDYPTAIIINPRRACAERVKVVVSCVYVCVCVSVCMSSHTLFWQYAQLEV